MVTFCFLYHNGTTWEFCSACAYVPAVSAFVFTATFVLAASVVISWATRYFFFLNLFFIEEKLWGWAEESRSVFKLQIYKAGLEHLSFYPRCRFIKKGAVSEMDLLLFSAEQNLLAVWGLLAVWLQAQSTIQFYLCFLSQYLLDQNNKTFH